MEKKDKETILLVCPSLTIGGRERVAVNTFQVLKDLYDVRLVVFQRKTDEYATSADVICLDAYSEACFHIGLNLLIQSLYVGSGGSAGVHQHQRLLVINGGRSHGLSFPTALLNEPSGRYFDVLGVDIKVWCLGVFCHQAFPLIAADDGVGEEAAGVA